MISEEQIAEAKGSPYFQERHNKFFGNGFDAGVKFAEQHYQSEKAELVECLRGFIDPLTGLVYGHIEDAVGKEKCFKIEQLLAKHQNQ